MMSDWKVDTGVRVYYLMVILAAIGWAGTCRYIRGQVLSIREMDYMSAAESLGIRDLHKIFKHIMPNVIPIIIVTATLANGIHHVLSGSRCTSSDVQLGTDGICRNKPDDIQTASMAVDAGRILYLIDSTCGEPCR